MKDHQAMKPSIVMMGATGAVGGEVIRTLMDASRKTPRLTLLGRRVIEELDHTIVDQHIVDVFKQDTYSRFVSNHTVAICTMGIGQPSKASKQDYVRLDRDAVLDFATACKNAGVQHFQLLSSVGASSKSRSFYLRTKGELEDGLEALGFDRLSLFQPSMILTPTNRYGFSQALTLAVWPWLYPVLSGPLRKFRGIKVEQLGRAIANNLATPGSGVETLHWDDFVELT